MVSNIHVVSDEALADTIREQVEAALDRAIPRIAELVSQKEYLTDDDMANLTGLSKRSLAYRRENGSLPFIKRGRKVLYKTED